MQIRITRNQKNLLDAAVKDCQTAERVRNGILSAIVLGHDKPVDAIGAFQVIEKGGEIFLEVHPAING